MLKVLQLIPTLDRSGAEKQMVLLAKGLPRDRFRVEVATLTRLGSTGSRTERGGYTGHLDRQAFQVDPIALARLTRFLKAGSFDVVQTWIFAANTYGRVASRLAGVPVVVVAEMAVDLWKGRVERFVDRRLATWCDRLVGNSHAVVDFYRTLGVPDDRLAMIYSGTADDEPPTVDPRAIRVEFGFVDDAPLALFVGRLAEQKRVEDLLKAVDLLHHVQPDLRTLIVGDGPLRGQLEENAPRRIDLDGVVRFLGHRDDVPVCWPPPMWSSCPAPMRDCPMWCSKPCGFASRWSPRPRRGRPRSSSTARPGYWSRSARSRIWPGRSATRSRPRSGQSPGRGRPSPRRSRLPRRHHGRPLL